MSFAYYIVWSERTPDARSCPPPTNSKQPQIGPVVFRPTATAPATVPEEHHRRWQRLDVSTVRRGARPGVEFYPVTVPPMRPVRSVVQPRPANRAAPTTKPSRFELTYYQPQLLMAVTAILVVVGLASVYEASSIVAVQDGRPGSAFAVRQLIGALIGGVVVIRMMRIDYHRWEEWAWWPVGIAAVMLIVLLLPFADPIVLEVNGARRWLSIFGLTFQPSELAKLGMVVWVAKMAAKKQDRITEFKRGMMPFLAVGVPIAALILVEPDLSTAFLFCVLAGIVIFTGGARVLHCAAVGIGGGLLGWVLAKVYQIERLHEPIPWGLDLAEVSWQLRQSIVGFGSGEFWGQGFGAGTQKLGYLPYGYSDFIFSTIGEEWGFFGVAVLAVLMASFVGLGLRIAQTSRDPFGLFLATGLSSLIGVTAILHVAVNLGLLPTTGLPLPFISYGRSNLLMSLVAAGMLFNIGVQNRRGLRVAP